MMARESLQVILALGVGFMQVLDDGISGDTLPSVDNSLSRVQKMMDLVIGIDLSHSPFIRSILKGLMNNGLTDARLQIGRTTDTDGVLRGRLTKLELQVQEHFPSLHNNQS